MRYAPHVPSSRAPGGRHGEPAAMPDLKGWARTLRRDVHALYLAGRDPRVPWYAKAVAVIVAGYALSSIDLVPDFIPVLGYLDDLLLVPLGILLAIRLLPPDILAEHRRRAAHADKRPVSILAAGAVVSLWIVAASFGAWLAWRYFCP